MKIQVFQEPFPHVHFTNALPVSISDKIVSELEHGTSWLRVRNNLYELDVLDQISSAQISYNEPDILALLNKVHECAHDKLGMFLERRVRLHIHRFTMGTGISLHTDSTEEGARLLLFFKHPLKSSEGGQLLLTNSLSGKTKLILPTNNTAILFATHLNWFHAVTEQIEGTRYSMVFQLFKNNYSRN